MMLQRGDVVLVSFPFSSGTGGKLRPALVVQSDHNNRRLTNVVILAITTTTHRSNERTQYYIDPTTSIGHQSGLLRDSVVTAENIFTVAQSLVHRKLGSLPDTAMDDVATCLKASLALS